MAEFSLEQVIDIVGGELAGGKFPATPLIFSDVATDTRKIAPGALFIALKGEKFNGEDYAGQAVEKGAAGVIVSARCAEKNIAGLPVVIKTADTLAAYQALARAWREKFAVPVIAVTGSNGKTTTKDIAAAVLGAKFSVLKTAANFNNEIGLPLTLLQMNATHQAAVVEMGMRGLGQIAQLAAIARPNMGIVTNVGETHMELLGSLANIAAAKGELVAALPSGGTAILNADNDLVAAMAAKAAPGVRVITYGIERPAMVHGVNIRLEGQQTKFSVVFSGGQAADFVLPLAGRHNVYNALAAIAAGWIMGVEPAAMAAEVKDFTPTGMRFECQKKGDLNIINDAYNASPMSMRAALETLRDVAQGRRIAVLGDMLELGDIAVDAHRKVGQEAVKAGISYLVVRGEMGGVIADGAEAAGFSRERIFRAADHAAAAEQLKKIARPGDTILFKGSRGMTMDKIIDLM